MQNKMRVIDVSADIEGSTGKIGIISGSVTYDKYDNIVKISCDSSSIGYDPKIKRVLREKADKIIKGCKKELTI